MDSNHQPFGSFMQLTAERANRLRHRGYDMAQRRFIINLIASQVLSYATILDAPTQWVLAAR